MYVLKAEIVQGNKTHNSLWLSDKNGSPNSGQKIKPRGHNQEEMNMSTFGPFHQITDCDIAVSEFELQSLHYIHFRTNTYEKGIKPFIKQAMA